MSSCKLICKPWYIVLLCSDCATDQMSFCSGAQFFILIQHLCDFDLFSVKQLCQWVGPVHCKEEGSLPLVSQPAGREQLLLAHNPSRLGAGTAGAKLGRAAWPPQGCLLTRGRQHLGACLLSLVSYKGSTWKLRCWHWASRIQGRMRLKGIPATLMSWHDTFPPQTKI